MKQRVDAIRKQAVIPLILTAAIVASVSTRLASYYFGYQTGYTNSVKDAYSPINLEANAVHFF